MGLPEGTPLRAFEEVKPTPRPRLDPIAIDKTLSTHPDIQDGDIIILEQALSEVCCRVPSVLSHDLARIDGASPPGGGLAVHHRWAADRYAPAPLSASVSSLTDGSHHQNLVESSSELAMPTPRGRIRLAAHLQALLRCHYNLRHLTLCIRVQAESRDLACPSVANFMEYVLMRLNVTFINLDEPKARQGSSICIADTPEVVVYLCSPPGVKQAFDRLVVEVDYTVARFPGQKCWCFASRCRPMFSHPVSDRACMVVAG